MSKLNLRIDKKHKKIIIMPQPASEHNRKTALGLGNAWYGQMGGHEQALNNYNSPWQFSIHEQWEVK